MAKTRRRTRHGKSRRYKKKTHRLVKQKGGIIGQSTPRREKITKIKKWLNADDTLCREIQFPQSCATSCKKLESPTATYVNVGLPEHLYDKLDKFRFPKEENPLYTKEGIYENIDPIYENIDPNEYYSDKECTKKVNSQREASYIKNKNGNCNSLTIQYDSTRGNNSDHTYQNISENYNPSDIYATVRRKPSGTTYTIREGDTTFMVPLEEEGGRKRKTRRRRANKRRGRKTKRS